MRILATIFYALGGLFFLFYTGFQFVQPEYYALYEVVESALFAALFIVWLWDQYSDIPNRYQFTLGAVTFAYAAIVPEYTLLTAFFGAVALMNIIAAFLAWRDHNEYDAERALLDRLIEAQEAAGQDATPLRERRDRLHS